MRARVSPLEGSARPIFHGSRSRGETAMPRFIRDNHDKDGIDRRGFLKCMAWAGTGTLCVMQGGILKSFSLSALAKSPSAAAQGELSFVQISDSHMGFN